MTIIAVIATLLVIMTIATGVFLEYRNMSADRKLLKKVLKANLFIFLPLLIAATIIMVPQFVGAEPATTTAAATSGMSAQGIGYIAAAISTAVGALGAGYAVAVVCSSALGAVSENPDIFGKTLIFAGLAEGIAIYGLIVSILILGKL